jgi:hypothetical protein
VLSEPDDVNAQVDRQLGKSGSLSELHASQQRRLVSRPSERFKADRVESAFLDPGDDCFPRSTDRHMSSLELVLLSHRATFGRTSLEPPRPSPSTGVFRCSDAMLRNSPEFCPSMHLPRRRRGHAVCSRVCDWKTSKERMCVPRKCYHRSESRVAAAEKSGVRAPELRLSQSYARLGSRHFAIAPRSTRNTSLRASKVSG